MMNGKSGLAAASIARRLDQNQLEFSALFNTVLPSCGRGIGLYL
jgi:hypothetical protein